MGDVNGVVVVVDVDGGTQVGASPMRERPDESYVVYDSIPYSILY